jgi:hypothetical protein
VIDPREIELHFEPFATVAHKRAQHERTLALRQASRAAMGLAAGTPVGLFTGSGQGGRVHTADAAPVGGERGRP